MKIITYVNLYHILFVGSLFLLFIVSPILIYIGYNAQMTYDLYFNISIILGILAIVDHGYNLFINK